MLSACMQYMRICELQCIACDACMYVQATAVYSTKSPVRYRVRQSRNASILSSGGASDVYHRRREIAYVCVVWCDVRTAVRRQSTVGYTLYYTIVRCRLEIVLRTIEYSHRTYLRRPRPCAMAWRGPVPTS